MRKTIFLSSIACCIICIQGFKSSLTPANKAELGKLLFFDPILSRNMTVSCASCHRPEYAFADTAAVSVGVYGRKGSRNTPSAMNLLLQRSFFWDGRAKTLEEQALAPIENPDEMNLALEDAVSRLKKNPKYNRYFRVLFKEDPSRENLAQAIAAFERTLETSNSPFDNWKFAGDSSGITESAKRGFAVFNGKGKCVKCHFGADFTAHEFRNIGLFDGKNWRDSGRAIVTGKSEDIGKFKTPGLRNVAMTAPYLHNGKMRSLGEVIEFYDNPEKIVPGAMNRDSVLSQPLGLTDQEKKDLEEFLNALTDERFIIGRKTSYRK